MSLTLTQELDSLIVKIDCDSDSACSYEEASSDEDEDFGFDLNIETNLVIPKVQACMPIRNLLTITRVENKDQNESTNNSSPSISDDQVDSIPAFKPIREHINLKDAFKNVKFLKKENPETKAKKLQSSRNIL